MAYFCLNCGIFTFSQRRLSRLRSSVTWRRVVLHLETNVRRKLLPPSSGQKSYLDIKATGSSETLVPTKKRGHVVTFHTTVTLNLFSRAIPDAWILSTFLPFNSIDYTFVRSDTALKIRFLLLSYLSLQYSVRLISLNDILSILRVLLLHNCLHWKQKSERRPSEFVDLQQDSRINGRSPVA
jgi:hypothetical protein